MLINSSKSNICSLECISRTETPCTPHKIASNRWNKKNIPYFLPVVYINHQSSNSICKRSAVYVSHTYLTVTCTAVSFSYSSLLWFVMFRYEIRPCISYKEAQRPKQQRHQQATGSGYAFQAFSIKVGHWSICILYIVMWVYEYICQVMRNGWLTSLWTKRGGCTSRSIRSQKPEG